MSKPLVFDNRHDFRGGRNTNTSPDLLMPTELRDTTNARLDVLGAVVKRTGSRRLHAAALAAAPILGVTQWDGPSGIQTVAICNGSLFFRNQSAGDFAAFTQVTPGTLFSTTSKTHFMTFRASSSGAPLVLYLASGGNLYSWDGTATLTLLTPTNGAPAANLVAQYHTRGFATNINFPKTIFWSRVGDATFWNTGTQVDGGSAMVDVLTGDKILAIEQVVGSLLIFTKEAIVRFTGYSSNDIQISTDTAGVSADVGVVGENAALRVEQACAILSDRGAYIATEAGAQSIGVDIEPDFLAADRTNLPNSVVGHHRHRREIWYAVPGANDGGVNKTVFVYNYRLQNWCGPFVYPFDIRSMWRYVDANNNEWFMAGCGDGFVRHLDTGGLDDVLSNGTGGSSYTMTNEYSPYFFGMPGVIKSPRRLFIEADLGVSSSIVVKISADGGAFTTVATVTPIGTGVQSYRVDMPSTLQGKRLRLQLQDSSSDIPIINGLIFEAFNMQRPSLT